MRKMGMVALVIFLLGCQNPERTNGISDSESAQIIEITIKGSDTVLPLTQKLAEVLMNKNEKAVVTVVGGGSGVGVSAMESNTTDIAMTSRELKLGERIKLEESGKEIIETVIGYDALAIIIHPSNTVSQLNREQLEDIFTGKVKNWIEVGGEDLEMVVYSRETSAGTYEFFKKSVMYNKNYAADVLMMPATGSIIQSVSQTKGAIGYVGLAYLSDGVKSINVSFDNGQNYIEPSYRNAKNKSYPIVRPLFYYYLTSSKDRVQPFVDFVLSAEGQDIVKEVGYVDVEK